MADNMFHGASELEGKVIREISAVAMDAPAAAKSGHSGTAMALAPLGVTLWGRVMRHDPTDPLWSDRDRFILSNGHCCILQYALAHEFGYQLSVDDLRAFRQPHSRTPGHPERGVAPTVEVTTGPLGQGIANGVGMAIAERILRTDFGSDLVDHRTWVFAGDGCFEEGISHEAASLAGSLALDHLTIFYDNNHITIDGATELAYRDDPVERFRAYGWQVIDVGDKANDLDALEAAMREAIAETSRPTLIVVRSHIGFPSPEMMDTREAHGSPFSAANISEAKAILGVPDEPFHFDPDTPSQVLETLGEQRQARVAWEARVSAAGALGVKLLEQLDNDGAATITTKAELYEAGSKVATRKAMHPAVRLAALSEAGVMFVYTHDSVGVGEDGPTHEPVEHLMALRAMPNLHVVRPSDANETLDLVEEFLSAKEPLPTAMVLSRQDMPVFSTEDAKASALGARKGGYVVRDADDAVFTLVATGSEVGVCLSASDELAQQNIVTRVVALPCWRCFDAQPLDYRNGVLRRTTPSVSLEAGATLGWTKYVDEAIGIDTFGLSAPSAYNLDYFNMTAATVIAHVHDVLGSA
jgi:transketolase